MNTSPSVILAVDEAVSSIIAHGYQGQGGAVEIEVSQDRMLYGKEKIHGVEYEPEHFGSSVRGGVTPHHQ